MENRILVLAPLGRDARVISEVLGARQVIAHICEDGNSLIREIQKDSAATILTEEALGDGIVDALRTMLARQPPWSDYPFVVLAARHTVHRTDRARSALRELSNLVLLERPVNPDTLASAAQSALRARQRQYLTRKHLAELQASKLSVEQLNDQLETRIAERTADLASANDRLMHEILERERVENSRVQNQKMEALGRLTGGIAHDFNNLMHAVNLNLQLIERLTVNEDRVRHYARRAKEAVDRGSRLTGQLLSFARTQSLVPKLHDVNELIRNMAELISISVGAHVKLSLTLCSEPAYVIVDAAQMEMAILNLAVNSRDAMPQGGVLEIHTEMVSTVANAVGEFDDPAYPLGSVIVAVRDTGEGIAANLLGKVFDPFFTTKQHAGTGLGLSQVYGFTRQSGGTVEVQSEVGVGTTVRLCFPLAPAPEDLAEAPFGAQTAAMALQAEILVVEDDPSVRRSMVECLQVLGFRVRQAADGAAGLIELQKAKPDLLLLVDYLMPRMNGAELIAHARAMYNDLPIFMATGYADMNAVERLIGPHSVLAKPFDLETMGKAVSAELRRKLSPLL
ncbi:MAG: response regulator [Variovorax sp.]|nr:MAG: response regulator [Variovorax sp.]